MLEHYGRFQQSDFAQIDNACERVRENKGQTMGHKEAHLVPFLLHNEDFAVEYAALTISPEASLNASLYTAAEGVNSGNETESPLYPNQHHALENKAHEGSERQEIASYVNRLNCPTGWRGIRTHGTFPHAGFQDRSLKPLGHPSSRTHSSRPIASVKTQSVVPL